MPSPSQHFGIFVTLHKQMALDTVKDIQPQPFKSSSGPHNDHSNTYRVRRAESTPEDIQAIINLGRQVFYHAFDHQTEATAMQHFLNTSYSSSSITEMTKHPGRAVYLAEIIDTSISTKQDLDNPKIHSQPFELTKSPTPIAGFLNLGLDTASEEPSLDGWPNPLELRQIYIYPEFQGKGLSKEFMGLTRSYAKDNGFKSIWLGVYPENHKAYKFYLKSGFKRIGTHKFVIGEQIDMDDIVAVKLED